ncbi:MAG TPA: nucleoside-diphosphate kinase [Armatimonadota bacterium]|nr:nucleoside-diphosphate kinase [Armatimonadota bacterium]
MPVERTLSIVKPDALSAGHLGEIIAAYEAAGLRVIAATVMRLTPELAEGFYAEHRGKPFFGGLIDFMTSGICMPMVLEGEDAIERVRAIHGATDPADAAPSTIRARFGTQVTRNAVHGSDSLASAAREVAFFFPQLGA